MADLIFGAHGDALRLAAQEGGCHFQGLAAVAARLRRGGCSNRRLLRQLNALDAAFAVLRHITSVSVHELLTNLEKVCQHLGEHEVNKSTAVAQVFEDAQVTDSGTAPGGMPCRPFPPQRGSSLRADCDLRSGVPARVPPEVSAPPTSAQLIQHSQVEHSQVDHHLGSIFGVQPEVTVPPTSAQLIQDNQVDPHMSVVINPLTELRGDQEWHDQLAAMMQDMQRIQQPLNS